MIRVGKQREKRVIFIIEKWPPDQKNAKIIGKMHFKKRAWLGLSQFKSNRI